MYRVMIVDDEPLILAGIVSMLDWKACQCKIVGKAVNGQQALEKMKELHPDIVITDIKMPAMDGITYMQKAKEQGENSEFILLTNLEDFSLAKKAIRLGAMDYLIKLELSEKELTEAVIRVVKRCEEKQRQNLGNRRHFEKTLDDMIRIYFRRLLLFESETKAGKELLLKIDQKFREPVVMMINFNYSVSKRFTRQDQKKAMNFAEDIINEMVKGFFDEYCVIRREPDGFILVLSAKGVNDYKKQIEIMSGKFLTVLKDYFETTISVAVSLRGNDSQDFLNLFYQAMSAMDDTYYEWSRPIVFFSTDCEEHDRYRSNFNKNVELAQKYINKHYKEKLTLSQMADHLNLSQGYFSSIFKKQTGKNFTDYVAEVKIEKAKELIASHQYMMYEISDFLGFDTQYYFSTVFKKVTGYSPKEYENLTIKEKI